MNHPSFNHAHPIAKQLMDEPFYYSEIEESAPFGSDDGADTFAGFSQWRPSHQETSPLIYLQEQLSDWGYPPFDLLERKPENVQAFIRQTEMNVTFVVGMDAAIIAVAFGQLYLEGKMETDALNLAKIAIDRELHPELLELWEESYRPTRQEQLSKMLSILNRLSA
jgi:uncharacterized protein YfeS